MKICFLLAFILINIAGISFFFKMPNIAPLNSSVSTTTDVIPLINNLPTIDTDDVPVLDNFLTLDDLLLVNHPILGNTPMLLTTVQNLIRGLDFSTKTINTSGANDFVYTIFNSPAISYVCVGSFLDMTDSPTYFIVTSDEYQLPSTLKVGLTKEEVLNLYQSNSQDESFEWDHTMNDILRSIISYDDVYCFYGTVTSKEAERYGIESLSFAPSGLYVFLKDGKVVAFSNVLPGAN